MEVLWNNIGQYEELEVVEFYGVKFPFDMNFVLPPRWRRVLLSDSDFSFCVLRRDGLERLGWMAR